MQTLDYTFLDLPKSAPVVARLRFRDHIGFDPEPMRALYRRFSPQEAEERVCLALEEIARCLERASAAHLASDFERLAEIAAEIETTARLIGVSCVARVASDVRTCALRGDDMGTAATMHRLDRITEPSLVEVWANYDDAP